MIGVSSRCNNLRRKEIKEESTKQTTSVRDFTSSNMPGQKFDAKRRVFTRPVHELSNMILL